MKILIYAFLGCIVGVVSTFLLLGLAYTFFFVVHKYGGPAGILLISVVTGGVIGIFHGVTEKEKNDE